MTNNDRASLPHMQLAWEHHSEMRSCRVDALQVQIQSAVWTLIVAGCVGRCGQLEPVLVFAWVTREHSEHSSNTLSSEHCLLKMHPKKFVRKNLSEKFVRKKCVRIFFSESSNYTQINVFAIFANNPRHNHICITQNNEEISQTKQTAISSTLRSARNPLYIYIIYDSRKPHGNWKCNIPQSTVQRTIISVYHQIQKRSSLTNVSIANDVMCAVLCFCWNSCHNRNIIIRANRPKITKTKKK